MGLGILLEKHLDLDLITLFWQEILSKAMGSAGKLRQVGERQTRQPCATPTPQYIWAQIEEAYPRMTWEPAGRTSWVLAFTQVAASEQNKMF